MAYNIIFYFSDQQRWDTCGCFGQPLNVTPNLDKLAEEGVKFDNAFSPQPVCGPCRALFQTGKYPTETGCFRNNLMLPSNIKTLGEYMEKDAGYETAYVGKWHLASDGELEKKPTIDHTITAVPLELRGGYTGYWRAADVLEFTSHGYDGYVFDENNTTYYVMEHIAGGTLDSYILSKGRLAEGEAAACTMAIGAALSYMHAHCMVHLDLKPGNVMRATNGHIYLIDFGLSKQYDTHGKPESCLRTW